MRDADSVTDATDWVGTAIAELQPVDNALRCQVCKEFFDTPMITSCAHTFCSLCIRRCLTHDGKCPACRAEDQPIRLRRNWVVEEVVNAFAQARPSALRIGRKLAAGNHDRRNERLSVKRKLQDLSVGEDSGKDEKQATKSPRRKTRSQSRRTYTSQSPSIHEVSNDDTMSRASSPEENDGKVKCPICHLRMKEHEVSPHMDRDCLAVTPNERVITPTTAMLGLKQPIVSTTTTSNAQARISQFNYSLLSDTSLRKKLNALGIPSGGNKQVMVKRHKEWVDLWNANFDSSRPRMKRELLRDLDTWERAQGTLGRSSDDSKNIMSKDFDGNAWAQKNDLNFKDLIAQAKAKRVTPPATSAATAEADKSASADASNPVHDKVDSIMTTSLREQNLETNAADGTIT